MKVLVTGVKGQLGHDVVNELEKRGHTAVGVEVGGIHAVRQSGLVRLIVAGGIGLLLSAAYQQRRHHHSGQQKRKNFLHGQGPPYFEKGPGAIIYRPGARSVLVTR